MMKNFPLKTEWLILILLIPTHLAEPDEVSYVAEFIDQIRDCEGFDNSLFDCKTLSVGFVNGEDTGLGLSGSLGIFGDVKEEYTICLKVWKETDLAKEFMYTIAGGICESLKKEDTPWYPLVKSINTTECPIPQKSYPVDNMVLSLDFAKDVLRHEFVGDYEIEISVVDDLDQALSCHVVYVGISEKAK